MASSVAARSPTSSPVAGRARRRDASPVRSTSRAPAARSAQRPKRAAREQGGDARRDQDGREAAEEDEGRVAWRVSSMSAVVPATTTAPPAAWPSPISPSGAA